MKKLLLFPIIQPPGDKQTQEDQEECPEKNNCAAGPCCRHDTSVALGPNTMDFQHFEAYMPRGVAAVTSTYKQADAR